VVFNQGRLLLKVNKLLVRYLGFYRWNNQRILGSLLSGNDCKATMWASMGKFRHVQIDICADTIQEEDPTVYTDYLVEIASSLCQCWDRTSTNTAATNSGALRNATVSLRGLFQEPLPFNATDEPGTPAGAFLMRYSLFELYGDQDLSKMAADSGRNLLHLLAVVAKYRGCSRWKFETDTQLSEKDEGGSEWLDVFQAECAKHGMLLEDACHK
jgi:hypothetical protein